MLNFFISVLKKIIFGFVILYGYNIITVNFNMVIPINLVTVFLVGFLGFPALFSLTLLYFIIY